MSDIRVIKGLEPWEILKRFADGEPVAVRYTYKPSRSGEWENKGGDIWDFAHFEYAIIDTTTPAIEWDKFDWGFFDQFGGMLIDCGLLRTCDNQEKAKDNNAGLRESPFYYWPGGEQPVPDNVWVEVVYRGSDDDSGPADSFQWEYAPEGAPMDDSLESALGDIVGFKLTGRVL